MFEAEPHPFLIPDDGRFSIAKARTLPPKGSDGKKALKDRLEQLSNQLDELQRRFYAHDSHALLLIFQAMDAAGKDSTIRAVMNGVDPAGCYVHSFKQPNEVELEHDFLWRTSLRLPAKGMIGIFNRSYYEEVLVVRVHPEYLAAQRLPELPPGDRPGPEFWNARLESIRQHELHLARNGTVILKFFLNVSREEQRQRFLSRLAEAAKHWKFNAADVEERQHWDDYMLAYEAALNATSKSWAPWYCIPADDKPYMRATVSQIIVGTLDRLNLDYPELDKAVLKGFRVLEKQLRKER